jgi:4-hydroxybutyrate dehydrogenase/sulfolactaldehyde 3-reductase
MGAPMARNLIGKGFDLCVHDATRMAMEAVSEAGCRAAATPREAVQGCDIVITMLPDGDIVREVVLGDDGVLAGAKDNVLIIDMSTGSAQALMRLDNDVRAAGHRLIDAPVGRSRREAVTGNLIVMAGGAEADISQARPLFEVMADTIVHVGPVGSGIKLKLVNNYMAMVNHVLTGEVLAMAQKAGLDLATAVDVLSTTSAGRGQLNTNFPKKVLAGDVSADFPITMGIKDLNLALELATGCRARADFGTLSRDIFKAAADDGQGQQDCTAVLHFLERAVGLGSGSDDW